MADMIAEDNINAVDSTHHLDFEICPWEMQKLADDFAKQYGLKITNKYHDIKWWLFKVGTCKGQWRETPEAYEVLSIVNDTPGNGHFNDVLQWFEFACVLSQKPLRFLSFENIRFKEHLLNKRGFHLYGENDVEIFYHTGKELK